MQFVYLIESLSHEATGLIVKLWINKQVEKILTHRNGAFHLYAFLYVQHSSIW